MTKSFAKPAAIARGLLSPPIFLKFFGISLLIIVLFSGVAFYQIRIGMLRTHYQIHGETALSIASALSARLEHLMKSGDTPAIDREVQETMETFPDIRYILVMNRENHIVSHGFTFPRQAPPDLMSHQEDLCGACHKSIAPTDVPENLVEVESRLVLPQGRVRAYSRPEGLILEVTAPAGSGTLGSVRLGIGDQIIAREIASITRSLVLSLTFCLVIGLSLAVGLGLVIVRPIRNLVHAANRIRQGDFQARTHIRSGDEIGRLARAFDQMAEELERYQEAVREKEAARLSLLGRLVQAQEEERKRVARELHDQLGQSLSNALLMIEAHCHDCHQGADCQQLKDNIRAMIDDVRRLAWDVRPSILDDYGLDSALARYVKETSKRTGLSIDYQCALPPGFERLPSVIEVALYRIAQESITNIIRHAAATQASMVLIARDHDVTLLVEDNGHGFIPSKEDDRQGPPLGLMGMRERAALVGGELAVDSQPGVGATIRVTIPLERHDGNSHTDSR